MTFENDVQRETHDRVQEILPELFDDLYRDAGDGHSYVRYGSTVLEISVEAYGPKEAVVTIMSHCVQGVDEPDGLAATLLELNHALPLGAFSMVGTDVYFSHTLFGRDLLPRTLLSAVAAVADIADEYDDRLCARYGGQTALERIRDTGGRLKRSGPKAVEN